MKEVEPQVQKQILAKLEPPMLEVAGKVCRLWGLFAHEIKFERMLAQNSRNSQQFKLFMALKNKTRNFAMVREILNAPDFNPEILEPIENMDPRFSMLLNKWLAEFPQAALAIVEKYPEANAIRKNLFNAVITKNPKTLKAIVATIDDIVHSFEHMGILNLSLNAHLSGFQKGLDIIFSEFKNRDFEYTAGSAVFLYVMTRRSGEILNEIPSRDHHWGMPADHNHLQVACHFINRDAANYFYDRFVRYSNSDDDATLIPTETVARYGLVSTTALRRACRNRNRDLIKILVENGTDLNEKAEDPCRATPLGFFDRDPELATFFLDHGASPIAFTNALIDAIARRDDFDAVKNLVMLKPEWINHPGYLDYTPLHVACLMRKPNSLRIAEFLLDNGANPNTTNAYIKASLFTAVGYTPSWHMNIVAFLVRTPLSAAQDNPKLKYNDDFMQKLNNASAANKMRPK